MAGKKKPKRPNRSVTPIPIEEMCDKARYSDILESVVNRLGGVEVLRLEYEADYSGFVDIDVILKDGRVFSYRYWYGSCSGCDEWESRDLTEEEIAEIMLSEATYFTNIDEYCKWRTMLQSKKKEEKQVTDKEKPKDNVIEMPSQEAPKQDIPMPGPIKLPPPICPIMTLGCVMRNDERVVPCMEDKCAAYNRISKRCGLAK